jgi:hypothetical protein
VISDILKQLVASLLASSAFNEAPIGQGDFSVQKGVLRDPKKDTDVVLLEYTMVSKLFFLEEPSQLFQCFYRRKQEHQFRQYNQTDFASIGSDDNKTATN